MFLKPQTSYYSLKALCLQVKALEFNFVIFLSLKFYARMPKCLLPSNMWRKCSQELNFCSWPLNNSSRICSILRSNNMHANVHLEIQSETLPCHLLVFIFSFTYFIHANVNDGRECKIMKIWWDKLNAQCSHFITNLCYKIVRLIGYN